MGGGWRAAGLLLGWEEDKVGYLGKEMGTEGQHWDKADPGTIFPLL